MADGYHEISKHCHKVSFDVLETAYSTYVRNDNLKNPSCVLSPSKWTTYAFWE